MDLMHIRDEVTKQIYKIPVTNNTEFVVAKDGMRIKLHPVVIKLMVKRGHKFEGQTILGTREMIKL